MVKAAAHVLGVLILGAALAAVAQAPAPNTANNPQATPTVPGSPVPPTTAPTKQAGEKPVAPDVDQPKPGDTAFPGWNNPPKDWLMPSERAQYASIPGTERNVLIQGNGRDWRVLHNGVLAQFAGWVIVIMLALLILVYLVKGAIPLREPPTGRLVERFNAVERTAHWTTAITFVLIALTGLIMFFGKFLILPWLGYAAFSWLTVISKNLHNFLGPLFMFAIVVMFLIYVKDNLFSSEDWKWFANIGGVFKGKEYPSGRFNGLEKVWFWGGLVILGVVMSVSGIIMDFPNWDQARHTMQLANMFHDVGAALFVAAGLGHIYIGTIGMVGAYRAMRDGYVDETWAREHHALWYEQVREGKRPERIVTGPAQPAMGGE